MDVVFYDKNMRERYTNDIVLFQQRAKIGHADNMDGDVISVTYHNTIGRFATLEMTEEVPKNYVREAREIQWYNFWRRKGFNKSLWGYSFSVLFFLLFIK